MEDWEHDPGVEEPDGLDGSRTTIRQLVVRVVALMLLVSFVGSFYAVLRRIDDILVVIGLLLGVALVASVLRRQREREDPYQTDTGQDGEFD